MQPELHRNRDVMPKTQNRKEPREPDDSNLAGHTHPSQSRESVDLHHILPPSRSLILNT
jgi:hypothetical protein